MDAKTNLFRLGRQLRELRQHRGLTQAALARRAGITRLSLIAIEQGRGTVRMQAFAQLAAAMTAELQVVPSRLPTLDEVREIFRAD
ncbi:XRE family transcriptional regulator [mine drainage metagenome]|uniref:XRE family transcriptional regulator n=1 Tax=mine drainage metagenome TaxID=410659 RepID=T1BSB3_9ZZZZ